MAKQPKFETEDIERLLRAIIPSGVEDPFGRLEELLLQTAENHEKELILTGEFRKEITEELADIKTRTFGILLLQLFKVIRFFFGLLPQGRIILIVIALIGLASTVLRDGEPSLEAIKRAAEATGLSAFVDKVIAELKQFTEELAQNASQISDVASQAFNRLAFDLDTIVLAQADLARNLELAIFHINSFDQDLAIQFSDQARAAASDIATRALTGSNLANNAADLIGPILRGLDDEIRTIPALALKAIRLG